MKKTALLILTLLTSLAVHALPRQKSHCPPTQYGRQDVGFYIDRNCKGLPYAVVQLSGDLYEDQYTCRGRRFQPYRANGQAQHFGSVIVGAKCFDFRTETGAYWLIGEEACGTASSFLRKLDMR